MARLLTTLASMIMALLFLAGPAYADDDYQLSGTFTTSTWSKYLYGSNGAVGSKRAVQQTDLTINLPHGFYVAGWWSTGLDRDFSGGFDDELDWTLGQSGSVASFGYNVGVSYFDLVDLWTTGGGIGDIIQPYGEVWRGFALAHNQTLSPFARLEMLFPTNDIDGGNFTHLGFHWQWQVLPYLALEVSPRSIYDSGVTGLNAAWIGRADLRLEWQVRPGVRIDIPKIKATTPLTHVNDGREAELAVGATLSIGF